MPVDVETRIRIECPIQVVSAYAGDPTNAPEWYVNIESVKWETDPPIAVGSRLGFVARFLGRRLVYTYEVTELEPGHRLVMRTAQGTFPMETSYIWEASEPDATVMRLRNRGEPAGFGKIAGPVMAAAIRRANRKDLDTLKRILETGT